MSNISDLKENPAALADMLLHYEACLSDVEKNLQIKGKTLERANVEHASWMSYYDQRRVELHALMKFMEREQDRIRGKLWSDLTHVSDRDYNTRDKEHLINKEKAYLDKNELYIEVKELHDKYQAVVDAFKSRGFALNNIVKLRTSSIEDDVI